jgi:hypothetical protein
MATSNAAFETQRPDGPFQLVILKISNNVRAAICRATTCRIYTTARQTYRPVDAEPSREESMMRSFVFLILSISSIAEAKNIAAYGGTPLSASEASCFNWLSPGYGAVKNTCTGQREMCWSIPVDNVTSQLEYLTVGGHFATSTSTECYLQVTEEGIASAYSFSGWTGSTGGDEISTSAYYPGSAGNWYNVYACCDIAQNDWVNLIHQYPN